MAVLTQDEAQALDVQSQLQTSDIKTGSTLSTAPAAITDTNKLGQAVTSGSKERNVLVAKTVSSQLGEPKIPEAAVQEFTQMQESADETVDPTDARFQVGTDVTAPASTSQEAVQVDIPTSITAPTMDTAVVGEGATAIAALGDLPEEALVQSQMEDLTAGIESGEIPTWAQPAVDAIEGQLAARGLSRSSVGQAALTNAIIQAALPMAQQNAQAITQNFAQDKQFQQQANLQTASFRQQAMLSDQAATNASAQFNATSQAQTDQFMASLNSQIELNNATRTDTVQQFNAQQENAMAQFTANQQFAREQFNAQNATAIEQSNLQWRRQINQVNTAGINSVNQANAMNAFNLSNQALTFMWQELRDQAKWSYEATQNDKQRAAAIAQAAMGNEATTDAANSSAIASLGAAALNLFDDLSK